MTNRIPFNRCYLAGKEFAYMRKAVDSLHISGDGNFTKKCAALLQRLLGVPRVLITTSCTHALEMAALLLDIQPGDEIIVPSFTFVSTANAFLLRGARPIFTEIRPDTLNMDERLLESLITNRTKAVIPVHYAGIACEMDPILEVAKRNGVAVVEDNAHGLFGTYKGKFLGTFGCLATQSFHETKNITCGEGGALLVNDAHYIERAEIMREKGTNRSQFFRGEVDKYTWVDFGSSYLPSDILAAFLWAQLEARDEIQAKRRLVWQFYEESLRHWAAENGVQLPAVPLECGNPFHMFYLVMPSMEKRDALIMHLKEKGIISVFHYVPLHVSKMGRFFGYKRGDLPLTEKLSAGLLRLPFHNYLTESDQVYVTEGIKEFNC